MTETIQPRVGSVADRVSADDPRYDLLAGRAPNQRFTARPTSFRVVTTTDQVIAAVRDSVANGQRVAVRSGGHCFENVAGNPDVEVVLDLGEMTAIAYDPARDAIMIEPGARLADVYRTLYLRWGVTIPAGDSATVGIGGQVMGGGYGSLCRQYGLSVDHLHAVEVVVVDADGSVRAVVATNAPDDPNRDLWWAHTGGGGGNFGVVTRYWFRSPTATGGDPGTLLPRPPSVVRAQTVLFPRAGLDQAALRTLVGNFGRWHEEHSAADSPFASLFAGLVLLGLGTADNDMGAVAFAHVDGDRPDADELLQQFIGALTEGLGTLPVLLPTESLSWLGAKKALAEAQDAGTGRQKGKSSFLRAGYTTDQIDTLYRYLNSTEQANDSSLVAIQSYGGAVNAVPTDATASAQRDSVMQVLFMNFWSSAEHDEINLTWIRKFFQEMHIETGGVPVGPADAGCYINFADADVADPAWNTSGVAWSEVYYQGNYPRLRAVKAAWDPCNVFRHALSIEPAS
jgi:FAD/FMN-containing dehydrogenase